MTPMLRMSESLDAWGTLGFGAVFKREAESLDASLLPLQQGMASSSHVSDTPFRVMLISVLRVKLLSSTLRISIPRFEFCTILSVIFR